MKDAQLRPQYPTQEHVTAAKQHSTQAAEDKDTAHSNADKPDGKNKKNNGEYKEPTENSLAETAKKNSM